jgi:hypothetical protein
MLGQVGQQVAKALGDRFSLTNVLPVTILAGLVWLLMLSGAYTNDPVGLTTVLHRLGAQPQQAVLVGFGVVVVALLLRPFQVALVQFLEGYWSSRAMRLVADVATEQHRRRRDTAQIVTEVPIPESTDVSFDSVYLHARRKWHAERRQRHALGVLGRYPGTENVMPTRLGNVLRWGEDVAGSRYGLDVNAIASRLWPSLSPKMADAISRSLDLIDTMSALCVVSGVAVLATLPLIWHPNAWSWIALVAAVMTVVAYRAALRAATGHATLLATAVDLHRFDMLAALHFRLPATPAVEVRFNEKLSDFFAAEGARPAHEVFRGPYDHRLPPVKPDRAT